MMVTSIRLVRSGMFPALLALALIISLTTTSASSLRRLLQGGQAGPASASAREQRAQPEASGRGKGAAVAARPSAGTAPLDPLNSGVNGFLGFLQVNAPQSEAIAIYASDCVTPKTSFALGETVCAKVTNAPVGVIVLRRFSWSVRSLATVRSVNVTNGTQTDTFTIPSSPTSSLGALTIDNRGVWRVSTVDPESGLRASSFFTVHDPVTPSTDLSINQWSGQSSDGVAPDGDVDFDLQVINNGPDTAQGVSLTNAAPANTSFVSVTQTSGQAFDCASVDGTVNCTADSLPKDAKATFRVRRHVDRGMADGSSITDVASVTSTTAELDASDNASAFDVGVSSAATASTTCTLSCPGDITSPVTGIKIQLDNDGNPVLDANGSPIPVLDENNNQIKGANVSYSVDADGASCAPVTCTTPSGAFFPVGTTPVTCTADTGDSCSFNVTVVGITITLNGSNPLLISCAGQTFNDPGATAQTADGQPLNVTASGTVDVNTPGTYTITYTATDGTDTVTATRTVIVEQGGAPTVTVTGRELTVECHTGFTDPGATASDCSGDIPVTTTSDVDVNTPGTYTITYTATNGVQVATASRVVHVVDTLAPVPSVDPLPTARGECSVTLTAPTANDSCAGSITATTNDPTTYTEQGTYLVTWTYTDAGGNTATQTQTVVVKDETAPSLTVTQPAAASADASCQALVPDVTAQSSATDACGGTITLTQSPGAGTPVGPGTHTITVTATDAAGNSKSAETAFVVNDVTPPSITLNGDSLMTVECHTGFTDPGATASDACAGNLTGAITVTGSVDPNAVGTYTLTYSVSDGSNTSTATRTVKVVDTTPPALSCPADIVVTLPANTTATSMPVTFPAPAATDGCSSSVNVATSVPSGSAFNVGTTPVTVTATDSAGNTSNCTFSVTVLYRFTGFFSPIGNLPVLNQVNAGKAIPVKFSLSGNKGLSFTAPGYPVSGPISCNSNDPVVDVTATVEAGGSTLSYDAAGDQYVYVWKTDSSWTGTCRQLVVKLNDGSLHRANFKFK